MILGSESLRSAARLYEGSARPGKPKSDASRSDVGPCHCRVEPSQVEGQASNFEVDPSDSGGPSSKSEVECLKSEVEPADFRVESSNLEVESSKFEAEALKFQGGPAFSRAESLKSEVNASDSEVDR